MDGHFIRSDTFCAFFEHDVAVINGKPVLLSTFKYIYEALGITSNEEEPFTMDFFRFFLTLQRKHF